MPRLLIAFESEEGQTAKIAHHLADLAGQKGLHVDLVDVREASSHWVPDEFDSAIIAGSVHRGRHGAALKDFVRRHLLRLDETPTAFISVSLAAGARKQSELDEVRRWAEAFCASAGWTPDAVHCAAGAMRDSRLGFCKRLVLHNILKREGVELDPSGDTEFTDWKKLDDFAERFLETVGVEA